MLCFMAEAAKAQFLPPGFKGGPTNTPLESWSFYDPTNWTDDDSYAPVSFTNLNYSYLGNGRSLVVDTNVPAWLQYNVWESDGTTNLTVDSGTLMFWFAPDWASTNDAGGGFGPGEYGRLFEVGGYTDDSSYGWWSVFVDPGGNNIYFSAQTNDLSSTITTYLSAPIDWTTNYFHFITLTYSPTNTALFLDGQFVTNGAPMTVYPGPDVLANGFYIGSDSNGVLQSHGLFNELETFNYPLDTNDIQTFFNWEYNTYIINPWNIVSMALISSAPSSPSPLASTYDIITGIMQPIGSVTAISSTNVWITNVVVSAVGGGTNNMRLQFTIQGGFDGIPYDTFVNSVLDFSSNTNLAWSWQGQGHHGNTYVITNLPNTTCFLILGTPQDSDGDGLTDAYERLVSKTNPYVANTSGDGISDSDKILDGLNPLGYYPQWKLDSDNDSLPDAYESATSGLNPNSAEPPPGLPSYSAAPIQ